MNAKYEGLAAELVKATPPTSVGGLLVFGIPLSDAVLLLTGLYTAFLFYFMLRDKWWRDDYDERKD